VCGSTCSSSVVGGGSSDSSPSAPSTPSTP
jgi:hypothetical protein